LKPVVSAKASWMRLWSMMTSLSLPLKKKLDT